MILQYFYRKENSQKKKAQEIYVNIINLSKNLLKKNNFFTNKNYNTSFELVSLFLIIYIKLNIKYRINDYVKINEDLISTFINDLDESLRTEGIGDMSIGKYVKSFVKKFYFRLEKFPNNINNLSEKQFQDYLKLFNIIKPNLIVNSSIKFNAEFNIILQSYIK